MRLHNRFSKQAVIHNMDRINHEVINCQESLNEQEFQQHANQMMRNAYQLDSLLAMKHNSDISRVMHQLKDYIKQLQHPVTNHHNQISTKTRHMGTYIIKCLATLNNYL